MRRLLAALALTFALPAAAQAPPDSVAWQRFWPDAVGDEWQYRSVCSPSFPGCNGQPVYLYRYEVIGDTLIEGSRFAVVSGRRNGGAEGRCAVGVHPGDLWFSLHDVAGFPRAYCSPVGDWYPGSSLVIARDRPHAPTPVVVGPQSYTVDAVVTTGIPVDSYSFAADIGLYRRAWRGGGGGQWEQAWITELQYAVVDGVTYGAPVVAGEAGPSEAGHAVTVSPNPTQTAVSLVLTLARPGTARMEVLDLLGRPVLVRDLGAQGAGTSEHSVDVSALPAGVYVLRAFTPDGVATRRFVRAD